MQYRVGRDGSELGAFSEEQLREGLQSGQFVASDLAWRPGMTQWLSIELALAWMPGAQAIEGTVYPVTATATMGGQAHVGVGVMPVPGTAIASLILGLLPVVACGFGILLCVPGVICGHMALSAINTPGARFDGRGLAIAGLVLNYLWLALAALVIAFLCLFLWRPGLHRCRVRVEWDGEPQMDADGHGSLVLGFNHEWTRIYTNGFEGGCWENLKTSRSCSGEGVFGNAVIVG